MTGSVGCAIYSRGLKRLRIVEPYSVRKGHVFRLKKQQAPEKVFRGLLLFNEGAASVTLKQLAF
jgi:hypothetical protein